MLQLQATLRSPLRLSIPTIAACLQLAADTCRARGGEGMLARCYENGWGVGQDAAEEAKLYRKAAERCGLASSPRALARTLAQHTRRAVFGCVYPSTVLIVFVLILVPCPVGG
eukprot:SAG22_NODE_136_length_18095_cov_19.897255_7_plen_113_part_00